MKSEFAKMVAVLLVLITTVFSLPLVQAEEQAVLTIGVMSCLSSDCAEWGENTRRGVELAIEQVNSSGGVLGRKLEAVYQDSRDVSPSYTRSAYQQLSSNNKINFIIGPTWTIGGMAIAPLIARNQNQIVVSPSVGVREFNETADNIFNTWPHDERATRKLASYAIAQGLKTAAIFGSQDPWVETQSRIFSEEYSKLGGKIIAQVTPLPGSRDLATEALQIQKASPEVVFISNYQADIIAQEFAELKFKAVKLSILMEQERVKSANGALEGTIFALYQEPAQDFKQAFINKFKIAPGITADTAYDALMLFVAGIQKAQSFEPLKVRAQLQEIRDFRGASGTFSVAADGSVNKQPVLWKVSGETYLRVEQ